MKRLFQGINGKLILLISSILCTTIVVIFASTLWILNGFQRKNVGQALSRTELLVNTLVTSKLQELKVQAQLVGELPILNTGVENGEVNTIRDIGRTYRDNMGAAILDVMGREGEVIASVGAALPEGDTLARALSQRIIEEGGLATVFPRGGRLVLLGGAPIGTSEDPSGVLLVGMELDSAFAGRVRDFTKSEISFLVDGKVRGSSLPAAEQAEVSAHLSRESGKYASKSLVLKDSEGRALGEAVIQMPLEEHRQMLSALKYSLAAIGLAVFLLACGVSFRFSTGFTRPIAGAVAFAQKLAAGDRDTPIEVNRSDELGVLQESLEKMRVSLKELIENMDARIKEGIRHVTNILDNLDGGFLIFGKEGAVKPGYSRVSEDYFGNDLAGRKLEEILRIDPAVWNNIAGWRDILFNGVLPFKDAAELGPGSYEKLADRYIELAYRPIYKDSVLEGTILIATDKTAERELYRKFELEKERVDMIIKITTNRQGFLDFIKESRSVIAALQAELAQAGADAAALDLEGAFRVMHTLKGNAAMYSCSRIKSIAHSLEADLMEIREREGSGFREFLPKLRAGTVALEEAVEKVVGDNRALIGEEIQESAEFRQLTVNVSMLSSLEQALLQNFRRESMVYRMFLENLVLEPIMPALRKYESAALDLAGRRSKLLKPIRWEGDGVKVRLGAYKKLVASLVHAFRNSVDHGIEPPDIRQESGKDPEGLITVKVEVSEGEESRLRIRIKDDGKGIDPGVIRRKVLEKGLASESALAGMGDGEVIQYVFKNGFSTVENVTDVSGRGVGMDAIAYEAKRLEGRAWLESKLGEGSELNVEVAFHA